MWFVYMVRCADGSLYTGCTNHLERRLATHNRGAGARYTRARLPVELVWQRRVRDRSRALSVEAKVKQLSRAEKLSLLTSTPAPAARALASPPKRRR
jgi:putative endonuclease